MWNASNKFLTPLCVKWETEIYLKSFKMSHADRRHFIFVFGKTMESWREDQIRQLEYRVAETDKDGDRGYQQLSILVVSRRTDKQKSTFSDYLFELRMIYVYIKHKNCLACAVDWWKYCHLHLDSDGKCESIVASMYETGDTFVIICENVW